MHCSALVLHRTPVSTLGDVCASGMACRSLNRTGHDLDVMDFFGPVSSGTQVKIYDDDTVTDDDGLGKTEFTLGTLMSAPGRTVVEQLKHRSGRLAM